MLTVRLFPLCYNVNIIGSRENTMDIDTLIAETQKVVDDLNAFKSQQLETAFVPTQAQVQAAVDAGIIAAFTPVVNG